MFYKLNPIIDILKIYYFYIDNIGHFPIIELLIDKT